MSEQNQEDFKFYVIGAGLPRTGTLSMKVALEQILPGKCMHFYNVFSGNLTEVLDDVLGQTSTDESFKDYFQKHNIVAGVDSPFIFHYERAMKIFPEAKVVLTVREPSTWVSSMRNTVYAFWQNRTLQTFPTTLLNYFVPSMNRFLDYAENSYVLSNAVKNIHDGKGEEFYEKWVEDVKKTVPPERLLIFSVKEGWEPLCKFLDLPIPDEPFPNVNDANNFQREVNNYKSKAWLLFIALLAIPTLFVYNLFHNYIV